MLRDQKRVPPARGFEPSEYKARLGKMQAAMQAQSIGALLITTQDDMYYFTGFLSQFWQSPTRPWFTLIPQQGRPIAVIPEIGASCMRSEYMQDIRTWSSPHESDDGVSLLVETIVEVLEKADGIAKQRVGLHKGRETFIRMPLADFERFQTQLSKRRSKLNFLNVTPLLQQLRMIKSAAEIEKIHYVAQCASDVFENLSSFVELGMSDVEIFKQFKMQCLQAGVDDVAFLVGGADVGGYDDIIAPPSGRILSEGDVLILDTGCTYDGYYCDFDRNYGFGQVDDAAKRAYQTVWQATEAGLAAAVVGNSCRDLFDAMDSVMQHGGALGQSVGRYGHGLGIQLTEAPSHTSWDDTPLEEGMVITLEPGMIFKSNKMMVHEENLVITKDGPLLLSRRAEPELPIY